MPQHFYLKSPFDLLQKLKWGINRFKEAAEAEEQFFPAAYFAFDCGITAWSMVDWVWKYHHEELSQKFRGRNDFATWVRNESDSLRICYQLPTSAKHLGVDSYADENLKAEIEWEADHLFRAGGPVGQPLVRYKSIFTVDDSGNKISALDVLEGAYHFWCRELQIDPVK